MGTQYKIAGPVVLSISALLLLATHALAANMTFELKGTGGNMAGSEWISAEGEIKENTAGELEKWLNSKWNFAKEPIKYEVHINSPGGSLIGGFKLGEFFRKHNFSTVVAKTIPDGAGYWTSARGTCASACAIAFIGGVERHAESGTLGVHQFYDEISIKNPSEKAFDALDMSTQQFVSAILIGYVFRMGVDPRFAALASATPPTQIHYLTSEELDGLKVNWSPKEFEPWAIEPSGHGVIAFTRTKDKTETAVLFCRRNKVPILFIKSALADFTWYQQAMEQMTSMTAFGITVPRSAVTLKSMHGEPALELTLPGFDPARVMGTKWIGTGVDGPHYMWSGFVFDLPHANAVPTMSMALKNCT